MTLVQGITDIFLPFPGNFHAKKAFISHEMSRYFHHLNGFQFLQPELPRPTTLSPAFTQNTYNLCQIPPWLFNRSNMWALYTSPMHSLYIIYAGLTDAGQNEVKVPTALFSKKKCWGRRRNGVQNRNGKRKHLLHSDQTTKTHLKPGKTSL